MPHSEVFGKYQMLTRIASGGMAEVWLARSSSLSGFEKLLAIKRMRPALARNQDFVSMFIDEAKLTVQLAHPNIVQVFDFGRVDDDYYMAMEYVEGVDLATLAQQAKDVGSGLPVPMCVYIMRNVLDGLNHAHQGGPRRLAPVIHRDISPQNVLVSYDGHVKVSDFGIAKAASNVEETEGDDFFGKLAYISPEQCRGESVDEAADLWSAGVLLHELLCNQRLFARGDDIATMDAVEKDQISPPSATNPEVPAELDELVMATLERDPAQRLRSAREAAERMTLIQNRHYPETTQYRLSECIGSLWSGDVPRILPEQGGFIDEATERTSSYRSRVPSVVRQSQIIGTATAGIALEALAGVKQVRANSAWNDEDTATPALPRPPSSPSPSKPETPSPPSRELTGNQELSRLKKLFVTQPNLWTLVDIGEAWRRIGAEDRALGAFKLAAAKFAQRGLLVQAITIYRLILEQATLDDGLRDELRRLLSLQGLSNSEVFAEVLDRAGEDVDFEEYRNIFDGSTRRVDVYTESPVLSSLNGEQLVRVAEALELRRFESGETILREGDAGGAFFLLGRGRVIVSSETFDNQKVYLTTFSDGDCFGEVSFFTGERRSATVEPAETTWVLEVARPTLNRVIQEYPTVRESLLRFYKERLAGTLLAKSPIFARLDAQLRRTLAERFIFETYQAGDLVIREGDQSDAFYAIKAGQVRVYTGPDDRATDLAMLGPGEVFGEIAAVEGSTRTASVRAKTDCELLRLEATELNTMLAKNVEVRRIIQAQMATRADPEVSEDTADI